MESLKNEHAHLSAVARYCCRADEVETSAVFNIFMLVDVNGTKSHAVYDDYAVREVLLASLVLCIHACMVCRVSTIRVGAAFFTFFLPGGRVYGAGCSIFFPDGRGGAAASLFPAAGWIRTSSMHVRELVLSY